MKTGLELFKFYRNKQWCKAKFIINAKCVYVFKLPWNKQLTYVTI
jgi:hypothetical protein